MKLEFVYSKVYFRHLNQNKKLKRTWEDVLNLGQKFENKYKSELSKIITIIPKVVGKPWRKNYIDVYIVDWNGPSFSHPLTLNVNEDLLLMLVILTHELLHQFYTKEYYLDENLSEIKINKQVSEIFEQIELDVKNQINILQSYHDKRFSN